MQNQNEIADVLDEIYSELISTYERMIMDAKDLNTFSNEYQFQLGKRCGFLDAINILCTYHLSLARSRSLCEKHFKEFQNTKRD